MKHKRPPAPPAMTHDEAWIYAVERAIGHHAGDFREKLIRRDLKASGGNVSQALAAMDTGLSFTLGNWGSCGPCIPRVDVRGSAKSHPIEVWVDEPQFDGRPPDLVIPWREVYEYVKAGRRRTIQLGLL